MKKRHFASLLIAAFLVAGTANVVFAKEETTTLTNQTAQATESQMVNVSNKTAPVLTTPVVEDTNLKKNLAKQKATSKNKKIDLRAVVFDSEAEFKEKAAQNTEELSRFEKAECQVHEALHGKVSSYSKLSTKGLLADYTTITPQSGPFQSLTLQNAYIGYYENDWAGAENKNSLYKVGTITTTLEGRFRNPKLTFRSMLANTPGTDGHDYFNDVWGDQYLMYSWTKHDQLLAGFMRNYVGIEGSTSPLTIPFLNRSQIAKAYNNVRALGVKAQGSHKMYMYNVAFTSSGRYFYTWFPGPEFTGTFGFKPLGLTNGKYGDLIIGGGIDAGRDNYVYNVGTAFIDYEYKRLKATIEYGSADGSNGSTGLTRNESEGFTGTLAYMLTPKIQVLGRFDQFDANKIKKNDIRREYTVGLNYFVKEQALRLMLNYTVYSIETGVYGQKILIGTQIIL